MLRGKTLYLSLSPLPQTTIPKTQITMRRRLSLTAIFLLLALSFHAQSVDDWEDTYEQSEDMDEEEEVNWDEMYDLLSDLRANPLNLNTATRQDLERFPFLTARQIEDISDYLYHYAPMRTLGELAMIESLDEVRRRLLQQFVYLGETEKRGFPAWKSIAKYGRQEAVITARVPFYERKGDEKGYLGYKYKHWLRYSFNYGDYFKAGIVASQDAGEPFFANRNKWGYDYYSFYLLMRKMGRVKTLALGKYRLRFGMGLVMNNDFMPGKVAGLASLDRIYNQVRAHSSRTDANYLQGCAMTMSLSRHIEMTTFISYRKIDATLNADSSSIRTLLRSGYHRTQSEIDRKHNASVFLSGANLSYSRNGFHVGMTGLFNSFDKPLKPNTTQKHNKYDPEGKSFYNIGLNYGYMSRRLCVSGETATGDCKALATVNAVSYQPDSRLALTLLQRFYSYKYHALFARSFSDGGTVQNESGVYLGGTWRPVRHLTIMAYTDYAYSPWLRYQRSASSHAWDNQLSATYIRRQTSFHARYRLRLREKDNEGKTALMNHTEHRGRLTFIHSDTIWYVKTQADMAYSQYKRKSMGWMLTQDVGWNGKRLKLYGSVSYFHTDDYDSRLYTYERGTRYTFSFPVLHGHGIRYTLMAQAAINNRVRLLAKWGTTNYFDRNKIGSSYQQINRSSMSDLDIQLLWKF